MSGKKGMQFSLEHNKRISIALKGHPCYKNPERGMHISESKKGKLTWNKGLKGMQIAWNKGRKAPPESIEKMVETRRKRGNYFHTKETIKKISQSVIRKIANGDIRRYNTDIELKIANFLENLKIPYIPQYNFNGNFLVDFALRNIKLVIECDGDYWHSSDKQLKRDRARDIYIKSCNWDVMRLKGSLIYNAKDSRWLLNKLYKRGVIN